jgi:hypothetical protein
MIKNRLFEKKVNYAEEAEAPMILGCKILKKLKKEWGEDSDIYYEIEDILIDLGSDSPRRLAMALKRALTNYDMWEAPYKGLVNKIEKWTKPTGKVNESRDEEIRKNRFDGLVETIEYYSYIFEEKGTLSKEQISDLLRVRDTIIVFGPYGAKWASFADEILQSCGCDKYNISKLCQEKNGLWESYIPMSDEEYLDKFKNICYDYDSNKITLFFEDVDSYMIEKRFGDRFKKYLRTHQDEDIIYKAVFHTKNSGYGNREVCVLYALDYSGYGVSSTPLCELSFEEFDRLFRNFKLEGGLYRRNDAFMYESQKPLSRPLFRKPTHFVKTYQDEVFELIDELIEKGDIGYEDLEDIYNIGDINDEVVEWIASETNFSHSDITKRYIVNLIGEYYKLAYENHLRDIDEGVVYEEENKKKSNRPTSDFAADVKKNKKEKKDNKSGSTGKKLVAGAAAGIVYLGKKYLVDPISKSLE